MNEDRAVRAEEVEMHPPFRVPGWVWPVSVTCIVLGVAAFIIGFIFWPLETWLWFLLWFLIFGGLAQGMLVWAATFRVAQARWTPAVNRLGHAGIAFLPVSFIAMIILLAGVKAWVPWVTRPEPLKVAWLNVPFMVIRDIVLILALDWLNYLMVRWSLVIDERVRHGHGVSRDDHYKLTAVSVAVVMAYTLVFSVISYDFIMSLSPRWFSTMFAPYYWVTNAYAGLAALVILSALLRRPLGVVRYLDSPRFNDMGNLLLGFSLFNMGIFFAQLLTIWYENLPDESFFLILRYWKGNWTWPAWISFGMAYAFPFIILQSRALKHNAKWLSVVALIIIIGVVVERYVLIVPSILPGNLGLAPIPAFGGLAFLGLFALSILIFLSRYPAISSAQDDLRNIEQHLEALT